VTATAATNTNHQLTVVILAAGEGTRMKSAALPKVLHGFAGRSLLGHALAAVEPLEPAQVAVVVGHRRDEVIAALRDLAPTAVPVVQDQQNGTGHAVRTALEALRPDPADEHGTVLVIPGDAPLLQAETLSQLIAAHHADGAAATLLTSDLTDPTGYGRVVRAADQSVARVVEHKDATAAERQLSEVSALVYAFEAAALRAAVGKLSTDNVQGEEYLPDVVGILVAEGRIVRAVKAPAAETAGVNDRVQLAAAHRTYNDRLLHRHMLAGVTITDPATTWIDAEVQLAADVTLLPNVQLHGGTVIAADAVIGPDCTLRDTTVGRASTLHRVVADRAEVGAGVTVGPFAYLRPGTKLADEVHIGTYVEIKNSDIGTASKVPHLSYVGDASIGEHTNIGAATVFVNYDGVNKHRSVIGSHARTGADNMFVAPVTVGDGAYTAAGSVIDTDVPPGALGVGRARQRNVAGWVARRRAGTGSAQAAAEADSTSAPPAPSEALSTPSERVSPAEHHSETETPRR
jgi:bifunctional UDP-N-acetylglucosamine pyrophosphorylase/glucosamine-1-phosphate N-acetyltransferase